MPWKTLEAGEVARRRSKKDTRRWCRGAIGRDHRPRWVVEPNHTYRPARWRNFTCEACGKVLDRFWPWDFERGEGPPIGSREPWKK